MNVQNFSIFGIQETYKAKLVLKLFLRRKRILNVHS